MTGNRKRKRMAEAVRFFCVEGRGSGAVQVVGAAEARGHETQSWGEKPRASQFM